jgi:hypothetical protein
MNSSRLENLMLTLRGIAPFLGNAQSGVLDRLGQWVGSIRQAVAELETPGAANTGQNTALVQSPAMRNLIARGFSFDLTFEPSLKVDSALETLKNNGFEVLRIANTADGTNQLRITVPGRDPKSPGPIHLNLNPGELAIQKTDAQAPATQGAHAQAAQGLPGLNAEANALPEVRLSGEARTIMTAAHLAAEAAVSASDNDPIRQMGIPAHMYSHQLDPILMGWTAFYEMQRPLNDVPVDPVEHFRRATHHPLMLEYKPIEVIDPDFSTSRPVSDDILDVEDFTVS